MQRETLIPDKIVRGWIVNTTKKHFWRVADYAEFEDVVSDGICLYYEVKNRYPAAKEPAHRMRLFQVAFLNYLHELARRRGVIRRYHDRLAASVMTVEPDSIGKWVAEAPPLIRTILRSLDPAKHELASYLKSYLKGEARAR